MLKSKLFRLLRTLEDKEWKHFKRFLVYKLPRNSKVITLFKYIYRYQNNLTSKKLNIVEVMTSHELGLTSKKNLQNLMSRLTLLLEEYLITNTLLENQNELDLRTFKLYNDRNLYSLANKKALNIVDNWNKHNKIDLHNFLDLQRIYHTQYFSENPIKYQKGNSVLLNLINTLDNINLVFSEYYKFAYDTALSIGIINEDNNKDKSLVKSEYTTLSLLPILTHLNELNKSGNQESFNVLYKILLENDSLSIELSTVIFELCEKHLIKTVIKGHDKSYDDALFRLYDFGLEKEYILYNNALSTVKFQNIIEIACFLNNIKWAEDFLHNYKDLVPSLEREENSQLAKIKILLSQFKFEETIPLITGFDCTLFALKMQIRWYSLIIYFVTFDSLDFIESQLNSFTQFFYYNKKRISQRNFDGSLNLAKVIKSTVSYSKDYDIRTEIEKYENIIFKNRLESFFEQREIYKEQNGIDL